MDFTFKIDPSLSSSSEQDSSESSTPLKSNSLFLAEALGGSEGLLVRALRRGGARDLREAIEGLPGAKKKELLSQVGEFRESLEAISRQKDSKKFYSELTTVAREMEREGKGAMAYRLYALVAKREGVSETVRSQALGRIRVMEGKGDFFEQMGMFGEHFGEVIFDKPMLVGMGLAPIGSGLGSIRGLKWAKAWGQFGIRKEALKYGGRFAGEVVAFTGGVSGVRMMQGEEVTAGSYLRDLEGAVYLFGGIHVMKGLGFMGHGRLFRKNPGGILARVTKPVVGQMGMASGIGLGNYLQMKRKLIEDMGWEGLAGRSAAEWIQYNIAGLAARGTVGRIFKPWEKRLEFELHGLEARLGKQPKGLGDYLGEMRGRGKVWGERAAATLDRAGEKLFPNAHTLGPFPARSGAFHLPTNIFMVRRPGGEGDPPSSKKFDPKGPGSPSREITGRQRLPTLYDFTQDPKDRRPLTVLDLLTRMQMKDSRFLDQVLAEDFEIPMTGNYSAGSQGRIIRILNILSQDFQGEGAVMKIDPKRKITLVFEPKEGEESPREVVIQNGIEGFFVQSSTFPFGRSTSESEASEVDELLELGRNEAPPPAEPPRFQTGLFDQGRQELKEMESLSQFIRRLNEQGQIPLLEEKLMRGNLVIPFSSGQGFNTEAFAEILNKLPQIESIEWDRRVNITFQDGTESAVVIKLEKFGGFVNPFNLPRPASRVETTEEPSVLSPSTAETDGTPGSSPPEGKGPIAGLSKTVSKILSGVARRTTGRFRAVRPQAVVEPEMTPSSSLDPAEAKVESERPGTEPASGVGDPAPSKAKVFNAEDVPHVSFGLKTLPHTIVRRSFGRSDSNQSFSVILLGDKATVENLQEVTEAFPSEKGIKLSEGFQVDLFVPGNPVGSSRSFVGKGREGKIIWELGNSKPWAWAQGQAKFSRAIVRSPEEIFLLIEAYSRDPHQKEKDLITITHRGNFDSGYLNELMGLVDGALNEYRLPGKKFLVVDESEKILFAFERGAGELWRLSSEEIPTPIPT